MNVVDVYSLLQEVGFLKSRLDVFAFVLFSYSIIWSSMQLEGKYLANKGLKLDNRIKSLEIQTKEKKIPGPKKGPKNKTK
ncbi:MULTISPECIES: hypothetical protein [Priestia]|uniref:hypothetical protein n=1 Tax=Priestia TaxID=2800373 RepID=UPI000BFC74F4|nr:hypothetical protein [Priestia aryabhattai]PHF65976.1 hypothetical protein COI42_23075 [Priestia aryabhattai]